MASSESCNLQQATVEELKQEIERLRRELDQAVSEKIQSAHYGLVLLEEKDGLALKCEELESLYENSKHELEITQEVSYMTYRLKSLYAKVWS
jgi:protein bicaudal D